MAHSVTKEAKSVIGKAKVRGLLRFLLLLLLMALVGCSRSDPADSYAVVGRRLNTIVAYAADGCVPLEYLDDPFTLRMRIHAGTFAYSPGILPLSHALQYSIEEEIALDLLADVISSGDARNTISGLFGQNVSAVFKDAFALVRPGLDDHPIHHIADKVEHLPLGERVTNMVTSNLIETVDRFELVLDGALVAKVFYETLWRKTSDWRLNSITITYSLNPEFFENLE